ELPGTSRVVGSSFLSTPVPITASAARTIAAISRTSRGWRSSQGTRTPASGPRGRLLPLPLLLPTRGSLAVRGYGRSEPMRKNVLRTSVLTVVALMLMSSAALAIVLRAGSIEVVGEGGFTPTTLPKHEFAPITIHGEGSIGTTDGSLPPVLEKLNVWYDKHGEVVTKGLPFCTKGKLAATTSQQARKACPDAIVGEGSGTATIVFPEQRPFKAT